MPADLSETKDAAAAAEGIAQPSGASEAPPSQDRADAPEEPVDPRFFRPM
nr:hypothetical protein [Marinicella sp. W31]MDC2876832.1 hypothetical protein [Marinicella sp. W31]